MCWLHRADNHVSGRKPSRTALEQELLSCGVRQKRRSSSPSITDYKSCGVQIPLPDQSHTRPSPFRALGKASQEVSCSKLGNLAWINRDVGGSGLPLSRICVSSLIKVKYFIQASFLEWRLAFSCKRHFRCQIAKPMQDT